LSAISLLKLNFHTTCPFQYDIPCEFIAILKAYRAGTGTLLLFVFGVLFFPLCFASLASQQSKAPRKTVKSEVENAAR
jgi:hypothetical protein